MKNRATLQIGLLEKIAELVSEIGFKPNIRSQTFYRKTSFGKQALHIGFVPHREDIDVTADVGIRFDALEKFIHEVAGSGLSERERRDTFSFGSELGRIDGRGQVRWTISSSSNLESTALSVVNVFRAIGLDYLEKHSEICDVARVVSVPGRSAELLNAIPEKLARNAVALAYICNEDAASRQMVVVRMLKYLSSIPNSDVDAFQSFVSNVLNKVGSSN